MEGKYHTLNARLLPEEINELNSFMDKKEFSKTELFYFAFDGFIKKGNNKKGDIIKILDFDRIKTRNFQIKIDVSYLEQFDNIAKELDLSRTQLSRVVLLSLLR